MGKKVMDEQREYINRTYACPVLVIGGNVLVLGQLEDSLLED